MFTQLKDASLKCVQCSLGNTHGDVETPYAFKPAFNSEQIIWLGKQIKQQLTDMKTNLKIRGLSKDDVDGSLNVSLNMAYHPLQKELCSVRSKEMALESSLKVMMNHSMDLCKKIQTVQLSNKLLEEKLYSVRRSRMEMRISEQELFKKVQQAEERKHKLHSIKIDTQVTGRENMETISNKVIIIQETFQRLLISAQVNWAEDPHLAYLMMKVKESPLS
ncbi:centromere protein H-like isoform 2-T2 [Rhinophrynus dorsalis]